MTVEDRLLDAFHALNLKDGDVIFVDADYINTFALTRGAWDGPEVRVVSLHGLKGCPVRDRIAQMSSAELKDLVK